VQSKAKLTVAWSEISSNTADGDGGGIWNGGDLNVVNDTFANNLSDPRGGAIIQERIARITDANVARTIQVVTNNGNLESVDARVALKGGTPTTAVDFSTIATNGSRAGGGIFNSFPADSFKVHDTILAANGGGNCSGKFQSLGSNLDSAKTCAFAATGDLAATEPNLGALADNGGPTQTMKLETGSPAIDAADSVCDVKDDQRGVARPQPAGGRCDIGAYEVKQATTPTPTPSATAVPSPPVTGSGGNAGQAPLTGLLVGLTGLVLLATAGVSLVARSGRA
jgi:hypothetical protein